MILTLLFETIDEINLNVLVFSLVNVLQQKDVTSVEQEIKSSSMCFQSMHLGTDDKGYYELDLLGGKDLS